MQFENIEELNATYESVNKSVLLYLIDNQASSYTIANTGEQLLKAKVRYAIKILPDQYEGWGQYLK